jgi:hypothetical protein
MVEENAALFFGNRVRFVRRTRQSLIYSRFIIPVEPGTRASAGSGWPEKSPGRIAAPASIIPAANVPPVVQMQYGQCRFVTGDVSTAYAV